MSDDHDRHFADLPRPPGGMFSHGNAAVLRTVLALLRPLRVILEIGVWNWQTHGPNNSTDWLMREKPPGCLYAGVDIRDDGRRGHIYNPKRNRLFIQEDSANHDAVMLELRRHGVEAIDLLLIDGRHSLKQVMCDWRYTYYLRVGGVMLMHDINYHAGPRLVFDAVNPDMYEKLDLLPVLDDDEPVALGYDFGLGLLRRIA